MRILFLEDDENRIRKAQRGFFNYELHIATTADEAIALLREYSFNAVSLDHDLGGGQMLESDENSGYAVAKFIRDSIAPPHLPEIAVVHSFNPVGAEKMRQCLEDCNASHNWISVKRAMFDTPEYWATFGLL